MTMRCLPRLGTFTSTKAIWYLVFINIGLYIINNTIEENNQNDDENPLGKAREENGDGEHSVVDDRKHININEQQTEETKVKDQTAKQNVENSQQVWNYKLLNQTVYDNFLQLPKPSFLPDYKSPCWLMDGKTPGQHVYCLPYVYMLGVEKCGTTDMYEKLTRHPKIHKAAIKEPVWWCQKRMGERMEGHRPMSFYEYITSMFADASGKIQNECSGKCQHTDITIDASASTLWYLMSWQKLPENQGQQEPKYLTPHYIHHVQPSPKFIILLRNPAEREYSDFNYMNYALPRSPEIFHNLTRDIISNMKHCFNTKPKRHCLYTPKSLGYRSGLKLEVLRDRMKMRMHASLYSEYIEEWLKVFPRENFHVIRSMDFLRNTRQTLIDVFHFLEMGTPDETYLNKAIGAKKHNQGLKRAPILNKTRKMLNDFFRPYNEKLVKLLGDDKFLWKEYEL